jgi:hypothetical protein
MPPHVKVACPKIAANDGQYGAYRASRRRPATTRKFGIRDKLRRHIFEFVDFPEHTFTFHG